MKNIFSLFSCRKNAIIEELNKKLATALQKNEELTAINEKLGKVLKATEAERRGLAEEVSALTELRHAMAIANKELRAKVKEFEAKQPKRGANGRFVKRDER